MVARAFIPYPDKRLRTVCAEVEAITDEVRGIWQDMLDTMYAMPGVGLAACQIGVMQRLAVVDCSETSDKPLRMANPEILHSSEKMNEHSEGSPNLPNVWAKVSRPRGVTVMFTDQAGMRVRQDFVGLWATSVQHQIDHLNGVMYFDHLSAVKRKMLVTRSAKLSKRGN